MINSEKLTVKAGEALNEAINAARKNGNPVVYDLHLLRALLEQDESIVVPILQKLGASVAALREQIAREIERYPKQTDAQPTLSRELNQVFDRPRTKRRRSATSTSRRSTCSSRWRRPRAPSSRTCSRRVGANREAARQRARGGARNASRHRSERPRISIRRCSATRATSRTRRARASSIR